MTVAGTSDGFLSGSGPRFRARLGRGWLRAQWLVIGMAAASIAALVVLVSFQLYVAAIILVLVWTGLALVASVGVMTEAARDRLASRIMVVWFATAPVASYFVRFPVEKSIVTYERLVFGLVGLLVASRVIGSFQPFRVSKPPTLTRFELAWLLLAVLACFSALAVSFTTGYAFRTAIDAFGLPLVAFFGARTCLNSPERRRYIVLAAMLLGVFLLATGAIEFVTGINLLPYEGSEIIREGEPRVNGPFITDTSFAIVSLLLALFLRSAPRMFRLKFDSSARILYGAGMAAAILACLLPLFRAVAIALVTCWVAEGILSGVPKQRRRLKVEGAYRRTLEDAQCRAAESTKVYGDETGIPAHSSDPESTEIYAEKTGTLALRPIITAGTVSAALILAVLVLAPSTIKDRLVNPRNAYGRLLSWRLAANIIYAHPVFGVGLSNYVDYFDKEYSGGRSDLELELDTHIVRHPHSNMVWIATELGLVGLALYLAANVFLLIPAWRAIKRQRGPARVAGACFIALLAAYWIPGLELTSGMYSELNLYFFFLLGLIFPLLSSPLADGASSSIPEAPLRLEL